MNFLDDAINEGLGKGTFSGFLSMGVMISEAITMLEDGTFNHPRTPYEKGIVAGLASHGFIKRKFFFFRYARTKKQIPDGSGSAFEKMAIDQIRKTDGPNLTEIGFTLQFAVCLYDAAGDMPWLQAKERASLALKEFYKSENILFGDPEYDWSSSGARQLAHDLEISYWD